MKIEPHLESMLPQLELRVLFGPQSGSRLTLSPGDYLLGTDEDCAVMLSGPRMQGIHARLAFDGDRPSIEPMDGSITDAQGRSVDGNIALALGMPVELGGVWIAIDEMDAPWPDLDAVIPQPGTHPHPAPDSDDAEPPQQLDTAESSTLADKQKPETDKQRRRARLMLITSVTVLVTIAVVGVGGASWLASRSVESVSPVVPAARSDAPLAQLKERLAEVAPGRYMSVLQGRDGKPEIIGYVSDEAMESAVRDAIRKIVNTPAVQLYVDQQLLVQTRKAAQSMQDPSQTLFEVTDVRNGVAVLNGTVISQSVKDDLTESLRSRVPGLRGTEAPLRMAEELPALLQERMTAAGLGKKLQVVERQPEFIVRGALSEDELPRWENLLMAFSQQFGRLLPIRATIMPIQSTVPVNVQTVIGGPMPFVITDTGERIGPGGSAGSHTLSSVGDKEVIFEGKQRIRIPR